MFFAEPLAVGEISSSQPWRTEAAVITIASVYPARALPLYGLSYPDGLTPHSLRRTYASILFAVGESPPYVMGQIGHTTPNLMLTIYARQKDRRDGEPERLNALVEGPNWYRTGPAVLGFGEHLRPALLDAGDQFCVARSLNSQHGPGCNREGRASSQRSRVEVVCARRGTRFPAHLFGDG
jgi:hypothetical protein